MMTARRTMMVAGTIAATAMLGACSGSNSKSASSQPPKAGAPVVVAKGQSGPDAKPAPGVAEKNPAGDIPDDQAFVAFSPPSGGFSVKTPEGWSRTSVGTATSFTDKLNRIEVSKAAARTAPTIASVTQTDATSLKAKVPNFVIGKVSSVVRAAGTAILLTYEGDSAPDPVTGKVVRDAFERYTFYRSGQRVDLVLSGPTKADNVDPWRIVSDSLGWI